MLDVPSAYYLNNSIHLSNLQSAWIEHIPFLHWLIESQRPAAFVELGTHEGISYCAACQIIKDLNTGTTCHAVDHWKGDEHAGFYPEDVYRALKEYHDPLYAGFSRLVRSSFDDAVPLFADGTIDLLHIDGLHTYEAVKHDYETWLPKLAAGGVVLFHDTNVRERGFGVFQLWEELAREHPAFEFLHGYGLGVLAPKGMPSSLEAFFRRGLEPEFTATIRNHFALLGQNITRERERQSLATQVQDHDRHLQDRDRQLSELRQWYRAQLSSQRRREAAVRQEEAAKHRQMEMAMHLEAKSEWWTKEKEIRRLRGALKKTTQRMERIAGYLDLLQQEIGRLYKSKRWRLANPLRTPSLRRLLNLSPGVGYRHVDKVLQMIWRWRETENNSAPLPAHGSNGVHREEGPSGLEQPFQRQARSAIDYKTYCEITSITAERRKRMEAALAGFSLTPLVSVVMAVHNTPLEWLRAALDSVRSQIYPHWEIQVVDDGSEQSGVSEFLKNAAAEDSRIKVQRLDQNLGISGATNAAVARAAGEFVAFLDHDDTLEPHALFELVKWLNAAPETDIFYSDEDKLDENGQRGEPFFKPDWSPDTFLSYNYLCHFLVVRRQLLVEEPGPMRPEFDGAQDYDLLLRLTEKTTRIAHLPHVLYHWRAHAQSTAGALGNKPAAAQRGLQALDAALQRRNIGGHVEVGPLAGYRVVRTIPNRQKVTIIIPTRDRVELLSRCIKSIERCTDYPNYEIVVVDNNSQELRTHRFLKGLKHRVLRFDGVFNYPAINNFAVSQTDGEWLLLLNNDVEAFEDGWLTAMCEHIQRPEVGVVGAKLLYASGQIQHAGVVLGVGGVAGHAFRRFASSSSAKLGQANVIRNYSAVTAACLLTRRDVFQQAGGLDEKDLAVAFNDVDFCIKVRQLGYLVVYTPYATLHHLESASRGHHLDIREVDVMQARWKALLNHDPYYNPNLTLDTEDFSEGVPLTE